MSDVCLSRTSGITWE